jgi:viologen exporter family transport system permease protein
VAETGRPNRSTFSVIRALLRLSALEELQYPANFVASMFGTIFWLTMAVLTVALFYEHTSHLGGWTFWETVVLLGVFNALVGVIEGILRPGIGDLPDLIRHGGFDLVLVRPVDPQLYLTFRKLDPWRVADIILGVALSAYAMHRLGRPIALSELVAFALTFASAVAVLYSAWLSLMCLSFKFVAIDNLPTVFDAVFEAARYPVSAYPSALRILFVYIVPIAWTTTTPASALVGRLAWSGVAESVAIGVAVLVISRGIWQVSLRRYASAGG